MVYSLLLLPMSMTAPALAANIEHGKTLVEQNCTRCHDSRVFTRPDHKIRSLDALKAQVERCESNVPVDWPQQDYDDVVAYLDATFYKFGGGAGAAQK
jgi:mono/diheme cytochrome c family protein